MANRIVSLRAVFPPFLLVPIIRGKYTTCEFEADVDGIKKEIGGILAGTELVMACSLCLCEIWAFDESVVSSKQKTDLSWLYGPFLVAALVWTVDSVYRVHRRVTTAEAQLKAIKKQ